MKIIAVSDLHGELPHNIPECDLLVIAGDICPHFGKKAGSPQDLSGQSLWLTTDFRYWLRHQPAKEIVAVWGNHDFVGEHDHLVPDLPWTLLENNLVIAQGLKIYGTPYTPRFFDWAFMLPEEKLVKIYAEIPKGIDILISHGPPMWVCDRYIDGNHVGSESLYNRLTTMENPPKVVVCGHIHCARGTAVIQDAKASCIVWNVSSVDETYSPHDPMWTEVVL